MMIILLINILAINGHNIHSLIGLAHVSRVTNSRVTQIAVLIISADDCGAVKWQKKITLIVVFFLDMDNVYVCIVLT